MNVPFKTIWLGQIPIEVPHEFNTSEYYDVEQLFLTELRHNKSFREQVVEILLPDLKSKISSLLLELE